MSDATKLGLGVLAAAASLGVLGDLLLRVEPWGINVALWTGLLIATVVVLARRHQIHLAGEGRWLAVPALLFAAAMAWRDSPTLAALNLLAVLTALALAALRARVGSLRLAGVADYAQGMLLAGLHAALGLTLVISGDIRWQELPRGGWSRRVLAVGRGLALAAPLMLLFGGLFVAADAAFEGIVISIFRVDLVELMLHLLTAGFWAWIAGGFLRHLLAGRESADPTAVHPGILSLGKIEVGVVLGMLNALFLAFVLVQFRYFFGGASLVETSATLTYAEYARRGFFELAAVAALVLPLLLAIHWLLGEGAAAERLFRALAGVLVVMLFVIMASAVQRMRLYQAEFGLTELRLYTTAFMGWLALVFLWFVATVLRGGRRRFAFGALVAGFAVIALLDAVNPDALIVQTNADRAKTGRPFDGSYALTLSADAVPALVEILPGLPEKERQAVAAGMLRRWPHPGRQDWRAWNWGRTQAWLATSSRS
ncbi:MAG: DUF4173 domain-containing protein [Chloroflexi bacterium]|nr:DUF4173 domain-containing protein [Chloroflexota bacterium]